MKYAQIIKHVEAQGLLPSLKDSASCRLRPTNFETCGLVKLVSWGFKDFFVLPLSAHSLQAVGSLWSCRCTRTDCGCALLVKCTKSFQEEFLSAKLPDNIPQSLLHSVALAAGALATLQLWAADPNAPFLGVFSIWTCCNRGGLLASSCKPFFEILAPLTNAMDFTQRLATFGTPRDGNECKMVSFSCRYLSPQLHFTQLLGTDSRLAEKDSWPHQRDTQVLRMPFGV